MDTYMEHTIYEACVRAMLAVEHAKPIFPSLSTKESAIKFMAVYMKVDCYHQPHCPSSLPPSVLSFVALTPGAPPTPIPTTVPHAAPLPEDCPYRHQYQVEQGS